MKSDCSKSWREGWKWNSNVYYLLIVVKLKEISGDCAAIMEKIFMKVLQLPAVDKLYYKDQKEQQR